MCWINNYPYQGVCCGCGCFPCRCGTTVQTTTPAWAFPPASDLNDRLTRIERKLDLILNKENRIMATIADLQAEVAQEDTVIDSAVTLIKGLADQVAALKPDQAAIDALAADIQAKSDALAAAVTANTPAA